MPLDPPTNAVVEGVKLDTEELDERSDALRPSLPALLADDPWKELVSSQSCEFLRGECVDGGTCGLRFLFEETLRIT